MPLKPSRGCLGGENLILKKSFDQNCPAYLLLHLGFEFFFFTISMWASFVFLFLVGLKFFSSSSQKIQVCFYVPKDYGNL